MVIPAARARRPRGRRGTRPLLVGELVVVFALARVYDWVRSLADLRGREALTNAQEVLRLEHAAHLDVELPLNQWVAGHAPLGLLASGWYQFAHLTATFGLLAWCYWRRPAFYRPARNALVIVNLVGIGVFFALPVMPPRLLPSSGFIGQSAVAGLGTTPAGPIAADQYAAMPSLHLAWATWVAVLGLTVMQGRVRRALLRTYPLVTAVVVVVTANHYLLDVAAGVAVAYAAVLTAGLLPRADLRRVAQTSLRRTRTPSTHAPGTSGPQTVTSR